MRNNKQANWHMSCLWSTSNSVEAECEFDGQHYQLQRFGKFYYYDAKLNGYVLYRQADREDVDCILFVPYENEFSVRRDGGSYYPASKDLFLAQRARGKQARLALYDCLHVRGVAALFFATDGTGIFLKYYAENESGHAPKDTMDFVWDGSRHNIPTFADILNCEWETLLPLCE